MPPQTPEHLRVLVADGDGGPHSEILSIVAGLGHEVIAQELEVSRVAAATTEHMPDVALVCVGESSDRALGVISEIVKEAACPVIAVLDTRDAEFVNEAARRGIFAYVDGGGMGAGDLQGALDIVRRRFGEFQSLEGAFGRRAVIERAKGVLMERHAIDDQRAFELLRDQSRRTGLKLIDIAQAVLDTHGLLPGAPQADRRR
jgi:AmiR/NasT family two-component response regulator